MVSIKAPFIRLNFIAPFVREVADRGFRVSDPLSQFGWTSRSVQLEDTFVPAEDVYLFCEAAARLVNDQSLGAAIGLTYPFLKLPYYPQLPSRGTTLTELIMRFTVGLQDSMTSVSYLLDSFDGQAMLQQKRKIRPTIIPAQTDAFVASLRLSVLQDATGLSWDPKAVSLTISTRCAFKSVLPRSLRVVSDNAKDWSIAFPAEWLSIKFKPASRSYLFKSGLSNTTSSTQILVALRKIIAQRLGDRTLNIDHVASDFDVHKRTLQRALEVHGLTFKYILDDMRQERAKQALRETEESIRAIARSLGYSEPSNFARSFKRWTGSHLPYSDQCRDCVVASTLPASKPAPLWPDRSSFGGDQSLAYWCHLTPQTRKRGRQLTRNRIGSPVPYHLPTGY